MTNEELRIKANEAIKNAGWNRKQVSISVRWAGYEKVIVATIRDVKITQKEVEAVLNQFRDVQYDQNGCGDILAGGNTFVRVQKVIKTEVPDEIVKDVEKSVDFKFEEFLITFDKWDHSVEVRARVEDDGEPYWMPVKSIYNYQNLFTAKLVWEAIQENRKAA